MGPAKENWVAIISGVAFGLILVFAGYQLFIFGQVDTSLFGSTSQLGLALTLGSTFGINLGEAMKKGEDVPGKFAFLASFFGTLFLVMIGYGLYSVYRNQITTGLLTVLDLLISAV